MRAPVVLATLSTRWTPSLPMRVKADASFSFGSAGTGSLAAASARAPKPALRLPALTTPLDTLIVAGSTPHCRAAAATSMARAAAPALR